MSVSNEKPDKYWAFFLVFIGSFIFLQLMVEGEVPNEESSRPKQLLRCQSAT